jgi:hypothetical protein
MHNTAARVYPRMRSGVRFEPVACSHGTVTVTHSKMYPLKKIAR